MPHLPHQDGPLARVASYDLASPAGLALLRRFDAQFHRLPVAARDAAVRGLQLALPLAARAQGLLVLPGGALAWRDGESVLVGDPASSVGVTTSREALQKAVSDQSGTFFIQHGKNGLQLGHDSVFFGQSATWAPQASLYADILPALAEWRGPAMIHWHDTGAAVWEMVPAPPPLALAVSLVGEALEAGPPLPRFVWSVAGSDECFQHLSSGLAAHLDEWLAPEVSDALRFALIAHWTDGEDSVASRLADGLGWLPRAFAADPGRPASLDMLTHWPRAAAALPPHAALLGLAVAEAGEAWSPQLRRDFLAALRAEWPAAALLAESGSAAPTPLDTLAADRMVRAGTPALAALAPLDVIDTPQGLLRRADSVALRLGAPVLLAVPAWGLCHQLDPAGLRVLGNGAAYGLGAGLEAFEAE
ncbi:hypothetical protein IBL26_12810 [Roseomonas aerophila]|uniref:Uncharacterized protein n=1 Tax=Teichococcus aerophilus TaxID=1224513 RepID=A0ABR7RN17_9PROT|nr:hypothetical protein [Pseudoroseomonas aerophila]MBC9207718.1 hypothetical protein [Pseudoroseomonas aerophila]